ncbi:MAG: HDOD domain-containing protein [Gammaproteobacteria bacterium]|nr:HDOD domain-containing protein [Gammaproteobacteria bacterium]
MGGFPDNNIDNYELGQLPSVPHVLLQLIEACHKADVSFDELSEIVQRDVGLCAKVLAAAEQSELTHSGAAGESFSRQLVKLGVNTVRTIAITTAVDHFFSPFDESHGRQLGRVWRDSLATAHCARGLAQLVGYERTEEAYLAGLLHKTGALLLLQRAPTQYAQLIGRDLPEGELDDSEIALYGVTASQLAGQIARQWGATPLLVDALRYQRESTASILDAPRLVKLVNFSRRLVTRMAPDETLVEQAEQLFELSEAEVKGLLAGVQESVAAVASTFGVSIDWQLGVEQDFSTDSEDVRLGLARKVREFALLDGIQRHLAASGELQAVLRTSLHDLSMLFGIGSGICFLCDADGGSISAVVANCAEQEQISEFVLKLKPGRSLLAESVMGRRVVSSLDPGVAERLSVVDRQLVEMLGKEGMICLPLHRGVNDIGVVAAAVSRVDLHRLTRDAEFLRCFAETLATAVEQRQLLARGREEALQQERELKQSQLRKLVHEANNPLAIIKNYLQVLSIRLGNESGVQDQLSILSEEIERVAGIILRMRDITPMQEVAHGVVDVNELIRDLLGVFRVSHFVTRGIRAEVNLDDSAPPILSNRNSLKQILTNLIKNAVEAMPEGGVLSVTSRDRVNIDGIQYIELRLADSGPGIAEELLDSVFRPVKSTKGGAHSGLGLTIVKNLLSDIDGSISCSNGVKSGAEFIIHLPRSVENQ